MDNAQKNNNPMMIGVIAVVAIAVIGVGILMFGGTKKSEEMTEVNTNTPTVMSPTTAAPNTTDTTATMTTYKDGVYTATGEYVSPGGPEQIDVKITLAKNVITDAVVTPKAERPKSANYQGIFTDNFKPLVVGKNINDVVLDKVSGSSLTPKGFNDALTKIKAQAK